MTKQIKDRKWFNPMTELDEVPKKTTKTIKEVPIPTEVDTNSPKTRNCLLPQNVSSSNWMKNFDPVTVEDLAVNNKKIQEVELWLKTVCNSCSSDMLLLTGPVGCGKTATILRLADKYKVKITEWISPLDIDIPTEYGDYEFKERQSKKFQDFIISAANFSSLLDSNSNKLVLVEDFPNTFIRTPSEFTDVLHQYKHRAKSPLVFICSDSNTDSRNCAANLFTPALKEQYGVHHISFNSATSTALKSALKRVADIISKKYSSIYNTPSPDLIDCVVNSSAGDIRSAVLNLHFASLKGSKQQLETGRFLEKDKSKKPTKKKKSSSKFTSIGKDQTVSILHGVGRVLNPKVQEEDSTKFTHPPAEVIEQFTSQPSSFLNFLGENYLPHFSSIDHVRKAAAALSDADFMITEWRDRLCQEAGLLVAAAGLMTANTAPVSAWHPVRGPRNMTVHYPLLSSMPQLEPQHLHKGKTLVTDYQTFCKIIGS